MLFESTVWNQCVHIVHVRQYWKCLNSYHFWGRLHLLVQSTHENENRKKRTELLKVTIKLTKPIENWSRVCTRNLIHIVVVSITFSKGSTYCFALYLLYKALSNFYYLFFLLPLFSFNILISFLFCFFSAIFVTIKHLILMYKNLYERNYWRSNTVFLFLLCSFIHLQNGFIAENKTNKPQIFLKWEM